MPAYLIAEVNVTDAVAFEEYLAKVSATDELYGGRYLAPESAIVPLEGEWNPARFAIVEFPDMSSLLAWYHSPEYAPLKSIRHKCADTKIIAMEGVAVA